MIKLLIADDHQIFIDGLRSLLENNPEIQVVGEAHSGYEVIAGIENLSPDVILLDINMPGMNGLQALKIISSKFPAVKVILLTMHDSQQFILAGTESGAAGYMMKNTGKEELNRAITTVYQGGNYYSQEVAQTLLNKRLNSAGNYITLSKREIDVLTLIANEHTTQEIADKLFISQHTVETHRKNLLLKIGVKNIAGLVKYAIEKNLV